MGSKPQNDQFRCQIFHSEHMIEFEFEQIECFPLIKNLNLPLCVFRPHCYLGWSQKSNFTSVNLTLWKKALHNEFYGQPWLFPICSWFCNNSYLFLENVNAKVASIFECFFLIWSIKVYRIIPKVLKDSVHQHAR